MLDVIRNMLKVHILAMEYPGYGLYSGKTNASRIIEDSNSVFKFSEKVLKIDLKNIIVFGRSIGSGPAT